MAEEEFENPLSVNLLASCGRCYIFAQYTQYARSVLISRCFRSEMRKERQSASPPPDWAHKATSTTQSRGRARADWSAVPCNANCGR